MRQGSLRSSNGSGFLRSDRPRTQAVRFGRLSGWRVITGAVLGLAAFVFAGGVARSVWLPQWRTLQVDVEATGSAAKVFWASDQQFSDAESASVSLQETPGQFQRLRFRVPAGIRWFRLDPSDRAGPVSIGSVQLFDDRGHVLGVFGPDVFTPFLQPASVFMDSGRMRVTPVDAAARPSMVATLGCTDPPSGLASVPFVTTTSLVLAGVLCLTAICWAGAIAWRQVAPAGATRWFMAGGLSALFLFVLCAKLMLIRATPLLAPYWDQWDVEARRIFIPFSECNVTWHQMFSLENEHRIFFSRLLSLGLLLLNGVWDARVEEVTNVTMHALSATFLCLGLWIAAGRRAFAWLAGLIGVVFAAPFAWDNALLPLQSISHCMLFLTVLALWMMCRSDRSRLPILGWICALAALFTMASGVLASAAIGFVLILDWVESGYSRRTLASAAVVVAVIGIAVVLRSPPVSWHETLRARSLGEFARAYAHNLAWPWPDHLPIGLLMWIPACLVLLAVAKRHFHTTALERFALGWALWVLLLSAALAYGRGAGGALPATRYMDDLSLGVIANGAALLVLYQASTLPRARTLVVAGGIAWCAIAGAGVARLSVRALDDVHVWRTYFAAHTDAVRQFVATNDFATLASKRPMYEIPYPDAATLAATLRSPYIRSILPPALREQPQARAGWASRGAERLIALSPWLLAGSVILTAGLVLAAWRAGGIRERGMH